MLAILQRLWGMKLHNKILLALVFGAAFGVLFSVSKTRIEITYLVEKTVERSEVVEGWERIEFAKRATGEVLAAYGPGDQVRILPYFRGLMRAERKELEVHIVTKVLDEETNIEVLVRSIYRDVVKLDKVSTIATRIRPIGTLFMRLLMFLAIPLVVSSLIVGAASLGDIRKVGRIGGKTIGLFIFTTTVAITIGLLMVNLIQPGKRLPAEAHEALMVEYAANIQQRIDQEISIDLIDTIVNIVPTNPFSAMANAEMLQVVFFALIVGVTLTLVAREKSEPVIRFFDGFSDTMIKMVDLFMTIAPFGVFALIAATVAEFGFEILQTLIWYAGALIAGLLIHVLVTYGSLVRVGAGMNPIRFLRGLRDPMLIAFSTSSSAATLPVNMESCQRNLGVSKSTTSFVLPLGATINMDGTSMYQAVAAVFIAQVYGVDLHLSAQLTILLTAVLASIGTAPVPGVGIVMLIIVLRSVHIPEEGIALILGIDRILDMCRTTTNVVGDAAVATVIAKSEGQLQIPNER